AIDARRKGGKAMVRRALWRRRPVAGGRGVLMGPLEWYRSKVGGTAAYGCKSTSAPVRPAVRAGELGEERVVHVRTGADRVDRDRCAGARSGFGAHLIEILEVVHALAGGLAVAQEDDRPACLARRLRHRQRIGEPREKTGPALRRERASELERALLLRLGRARRLLALWVDLRVLPEEDESEVGVLRELADRPRKLALQIFPA